MPEREKILNYQGLFNFEIIGHLLNSLKDETEARGISIVNYKKILSVMIEALENVFKYSEFLKMSKSSFLIFILNLNLIRKSKFYFIHQQSNTK